MPDQPRSGEGPAESLNGKSPRYRPKSVWRTVREIARIVMAVTLSLLLMLGVLIALHVGGDVTVFAAMLAGAVYLVARAVAEADDAPRAAPLTFWRIILLGLWVLVTFGLLVTAFVLLMAAPDWQLLMVGIGVTLLIVLLCAWLYRTVREEWRWL